MTRSGTSRAVDRESVMSGVSLSGSPKMTSTVSGGCSPTERASASCWITANSFRPRDSTRSASMVVVSSTDRGLSLVTMPGSLPNPVSAMAELLTRQRHGEPSPSGRSSGALLPGRGVRVVAVQGLHELLLGVVGQRSLQDGAAVRAQRLGELVRGDLADDDQERGGARLHQFLHALPEVVLDAHIRAGTDRRPHDAAGRAHHWS